MAERVVGSPWWLTSGGLLAYWRTAMVPQYRRVWVVTLVGLCAIGEIALWSTGSTRGASVAPGWSGAAIGLAVALLLMLEFSLAGRGWDLRVSFATVPALWGAFSLPTGEYVGVITLGALLGIVASRTPITRVPVRLLSWFALCAVLAGVVHRLWPGLDLASGIGLAVLLLGALFLEAGFAGSRLISMRLVGMRLWGSASGVLAATMILALVNGALAWGALALGATSPQLFWLWLGPLLAMIWMAWRFRGSQSERAQVDALYATMGAWLQSASVRDALANCLPAWAKFFGCDEIHCYLIDLEQQTLVYDHSWTQVVGAGWRRLAVRSRDTNSLIRDISQRGAARILGRDNMPASLAAWDWAEVASFPLFYERRFLGRLMLVRTDSERIPWNSTMLEKTQTLVEMLSSAVNHYQLLQNLDHVARHDDLTGIANESSLVQALERIGKSEFNIAVSCGLLYLDVNHFKEINDVLGHESGDQVLQLIAERLPRAVKLRDVVARLHGDEFAVLLTGISGLNHMQMVVQRLQEILSEPTGLAAPADKLTVSIGGIFRLPLGSQAGDLLRAADQVMYQVKRSDDKAPMIIDSEMRLPVLEVG